MDRLRAGRLADAVRATVGGRRHNGPPLCPHIFVAVSAPQNPDLEKEKC